MNLLFFMGWQYATGIFSVLLLRFRECLKVRVNLFNYDASVFFENVYYLFDLFMLNDYFQGEIGIFFALIILRSLEGTECSLNHKLNVLQ